jgi:dUTP pyrophosphatase
MKAIIPDKINNEELHSMHAISTPGEAKELAHKVLNEAQQKSEQNKTTLAEVLDTIGELNPEMGGMEEFAMLLALPMEHFRVLAPIFLDELERGYHNVNNQMEMVQMMNVIGLKSEDVHKEYFDMCATIDTQLEDTLEPEKRDFIKRMLGITYNALAEAEGVAKKTIIIPIEYCHPDAKMPAYAHLTDAGMDVFALEDITIMPGETKLIPLGIKVAIPKGYELQVRPKSGRCLKSKLRIANTPGTIDAGYRDEICVIVDNIDQFIRIAEIDSNGILYNAKLGSSYTIGKGEKFAQLVLSEVPKAVFVEVKDVGEIANDGRDGGFGSTGLK